MSIFDEQISRKPNKYPWADEFADTMHDGFWTVREFSFSSDVQDFKVSLSEKEREVIIKTLSAIGQIEIAVKKFWAKLGDNLPHPSISDLGYVLANTEVIHNRAYEKLLSILGLEEVFEENLKLDIIKGRVNYLQKYNHKYYKDYKKQYVYAIILFSLFIENVSLFSQFYIILWFGRYRNVLKDTTQQVNYTKNEECYIEGTEVLTPNGWMDFKDIKIGDYVYQYCQDGMIELTQVQHKTVKQFTGDMIKFSRKSQECIVTPNHDMVFFTKAKGFQKKKASDFKIHKNTLIPIGGYLRDNGDLITSLSNEDRLRLAIQADGSNSYWINTSGEKLLHGVAGGYTHSFGLTKQRKQIRLEQILNDLSIEYTSTDPDQKTGEKIYKIRYNHDFNYKTLDWVTFSNKSQNWCKEFVEECSKWDGFELDSDGIGYCSIVKKNIDTVQIAAILGGFVTSIYEGSESERNPSYSNCFKLHMSKRDHKPRSHGVKKENYNYSGNVYCITVPSGAILTRLNNKVFISGNCIHAKVGIKIINTIKEELPELFDKELEDRILHEAEEAFKAESKMIDWIIGDFKDQRISADVLKEYIKSRINDSLIDIGYKKLFTINQELARDFEWMDEEVLGNNSVDFFHQRPVDYSRGVLIDEDDLV